MIMTRKVELHHDGHGLNESIGIYADEPDKSGASHLYELRIGDKLVASIQFQKGPRGEALSTPGVTEGAIMAVIVDRMQGFNGGPYRCRENSLVATKVEEAMHWTRARADERASRGVLGKNEK
jgi:hypothetical protein